LLGVDVESVLHVDRIVVSLTDRRGKLPLNELLHAKLSGVRIEDAATIYERMTGKIVSSLGGIGNLPGLFNQAHSVAVDSRNTLYVVETRGRRIHKFTPVGP